jgi:DNA-binding response OmpR family regulator
MECLPLSGRSILIIDHEPFVALGVAMALDAAGANVISAVNVPEAAKQIRRAHISAAVVAVRRVDSSCAATCRALSWRKVPFMLYTACAGADVLSPWPNIVVLTKPAGSEEIVATVARLLPPPRHHSGEVHAGRAR